MSVREIKVRRSEGSSQHVVSIEVPTSLDWADKGWDKWFHPSLTPEQKALAVLNGYLSNASITRQGYARKGKTDKEMLQRLEDWREGAPAARGTTTTVIVTDMGPIAALFATNVITEEQFLGIARDSLAKGHKLQGFPEELLPKL